MKNVSETVSASAVGDPLGRLLRDFLQDFVNVIRLYIRSRYSSMCALGVKALKPTLDNGMLVYKAIDC